MQIHQKSNMLIIYLFFVATKQEDLTAVLQFSSQTLWFQFGNLNLSSPTWGCCGLKLYLELSRWLAFATDHLTRVPLFRRIFTTSLTWRDRLVIVTGDMNSFFNTRDCHNLLNSVNANNISALINKPTRITLESATVLDQFLAGDHLSITDIFEASDHCEITCQLKFPKKANKTFPDRFGIIIKPTGKV